ncbi:hypothetical protein CYMTET_50608 [Cymbomonas tetramitiformis]|uniref:Uncharacterized protein n=1 Tax=Cymbomonas tetramitiformis TaxID=36881 RepID=A0AAE0ETB3_9CHLO|nr:hypothetical protein CYMTET_50608 [Cymbomonas tetramitiformis]
MPFSVRPSMQHGMQLSSVGHAPGHAGHAGQPSMLQSQSLYAPSPTLPFVFQQQESGWGSVQPYATWQAELAAGHAAGHTSGHAGHAGHATSSVGHAAGHAPGHAGHATRQPPHATSMQPQLEYAPGFPYASSMPPQPFGMPHHYATGSPLPHAPGVLTHAPYTPAPMSTTYGDPWTLPVYFPPPPPPVYGGDPASEARAREWWAARERMAAAERAVATDMRVVPQRLYPTPLMEPIPHTDTSPDEGVVTHQPHHRRRASGPATLGRTLPIRTEPQDVVTEDLFQAHASQPGSTTSGSGYESAAGTQHSRKRRERRLKLERHRRKELTDQEMLQRVVRAETEAGSLRDQMAQLEAATAEGAVAEERRLARRRRASLDTPVVYGSGEAPTCNQWVPAACNQRLPACNQRRPAYLGLEWWEAACRR